MRISNLQFSKGAVVFAEFPPNSADAFLNNRPLIVVSNPIPIFNQVMVCQTGTKMKPGIEIRLWNYQMSRPLGATETSTAYPYNIHTIKTEHIQRCIGHIDPYTMKAIDDAILFFLGKSDVVPPFLMYQQDEYFGVSYTYASPNYLYGEQIGENYQRSLYGSTRVVDMPPVTPHSSPKTHSVEPGSENGNEEEPSFEDEKSPFIPRSLSCTPNVDQFLKKYCVAMESSTVTSRDLRNAYETVRKKENWMELSPIAFGKAVAAHYALNPGKVSIIKNASGRSVYRGISINITPEEIDAETTIDIEATLRDWMLNRNKLEFPLPQTNEDLIKLFELESVCLIVSRRVPLEAVAHKYHINEGQAEQLRDRLTRFTIDVGNSAIGYLKQKPNGIGKYNTFFRIGIMFVTEFSTGQPAAKLRIRLNENSVNMKKQFKIDFESDEWKGFSKRYFPTNT